MKTRKTTQAEGLALVRKARMLTDVALAMSSDQSDYITLLLTVLGNGVSAFCEEESEAAFEARLATVHNVLDAIARNARERLLEPGVEELKSETKH